MYNIFALSESAGRMDTDQGSIPTAFEIDTSASPRHGEEAKLTIRFSDATKVLLAKFVKRAEDRES